MSGAHRAARPRPVRTGLVISVRLAWRTARTCVVAPAAGVIWLVDKVVAWFEARFGERDPFVGVELTPRETAPDPISTVTVGSEPVEDGPEPAPLSLTADKVLPILHGQYPDLPASHIRWHVADGIVSGEVNSLDVAEDGQRRIVGMYAQTLGAPVQEVADGARITVTVAGAFADVTVTVTAVLIHDDTMPLPMYREAAGTLATQAIPDDVLPGVIAA